MLEWCTNRSRPPSSGVMKPKPFSSLNHLTVPVGIVELSSVARKVLLPRRMCRPEPAPTYTAHRGRPYRSVNLQHMEDPMPLGRGVELPLREVVVRTSRSSGPGGQHANVTASRVEAVFDVEASETLSDGQKRRVVSRLGPRVTAVAQDARSQARNRELALERLQARLRDALTPVRPRHATRPTAASVERRLDGKRRQSSRKRGRQSPSTDDS